MQPAAETKATFPTTTTILCLPFLVQAEVLAFSGWRSSLCVSSLVCKGWWSILKSTPNWCHRVRCRERTCAVYISANLLMRYPRLKLKALQLRGHPADYSIKTENSDLQWSALKQFLQLLLRLVLKASPVPSVIFDSQALEWHLPLEENVWPDMFKTVKSISFWASTTSLSKKFLKFLGTLQKSDGESGSRFGFGSGFDSRPGPELHIRFDGFEEEDATSFSFLPRSNFNVQSLEFHQQCFFSPKQLEFLKSWSPIPKLLIDSPYGCESFVRLEGVEVDQLQLDLTGDSWNSPESVNFFNWSWSWLHTNAPSSLNSRFSRSLTELHLKFITPECLNRLQCCANLEVLEIQQDADQEEEEGEERGEEDEGEAEKKNKKGQEEQKQRTKLSGLASLKILTLGFLPNTGELANLGARQLHTVLLKDHLRDPVEDDPFKPCLSPKVLEDLVQFPIFKLVIEWSLLLVGSFDWAKFKSLRTLELLDQEPEVVDRTDFGKLPELRHLGLHLAVGRKWEEKQKDILLTWKNLERLKITGALSIDLHVETEQMAIDRWVIEFYEKRGQLVFQHFLPK